MVLIQWASKKLTETEKKYSITEKKMLAVKWRFEHFAFELKGRKFNLITDHKALEKIKTKPEFNNARVNRLIEKIQEYVFSVDYRKGYELVSADALSRLYEKEKLGIIKNKEYTNEKSKLIKLGKWNKHVIEMHNRSYWRFDSGVLRELPEESKRKFIIFEAHER